MNRPIKFRAWNKKMNRMSASFDFTDFDEQLLIPENTYVEDLEIEQFTGLRDKNGKEIYERDIVACHVVYDLGDNGDVRTTIVFDKGCFWAEENEDSAWSLNVFLPHHMEVIGNIHENPDLIESGAITPKQ